MSGQLSNGERQRMANNSSISDIQIEDDAQRTEAPVAEHGEAGTMDKNLQSTLETFKVLFYPITAFGALWFSTKSYENRAIVVVFVLSIFTSAIAMGASIQLNTRYPKFSLVTGKLSILFATLAAVLPLTQIIQPFGWIILFLWCCTISWIAYISRKKFSAMMDSLTSKLTGRNSNSSAEQPNRPPV